MGEVPSTQPVHCAMAQNGLSKACLNEPIAKHSPLMWKGLRWGIPSGGQSLPLLAETSATCLLAALRLKQMANNEASHGKIEISCRSAAQRLLLAFTPQCERIGPTSLRCCVRWPKAFIELSCNGGSSMCAGTGSAACSLTRTITPFLQLYDFSVLI